jgi:hypothetical protein
MSKLLLTAALIAVTGPGSKTIMLNPHEVVSVRPPPGNITDGIRCLIHTTDGKYISVIESCDVVTQKLEGK